MSYQLLSYSLTINTPAPGEHKALQLFVDETIEEGRPGNTSYYKAWNHAGTHIDAPAHMLEGAKRITDLPIADFVFEKPLLIDVPKQDCALINADDLINFEQLITECDLLLIRTGFARFRKPEPNRYRDLNPGLAIDAAEYLDQERFSGLRAIAIDAISMASTAHLDEGIQAHKILFARKDGSHILLMEDVNLDFDLAGLQRVMAFPLFIEGLDSCHCTIVAEIGTLTS
jgi:arylformamidase